MDIKKILEELAKRRPVFHSEDDFKFELAWEINLNHNNASIRLEYPYRLLGLGSDQTQNDKHLDLFVKIGSNEFFLIELKYLTRADNIVANGESFSLRNHGAQNLRSYDVIKDISRIEKAINKKEIAYSPFVAYGLVIVITNDKSYETHPRENAAYRDFSIHNKRIVNPGQLCWQGKPSVGGRDDPLDIAGCYTFTWEGYSNIPEVNFGRFRRLIIPIDSKNDTCSHLTTG